MAQKFLNGVQSYFNNSNYTLLGYDSLDVVGGDLVLKRAGTETLRIGATTSTFAGDVTLGTGKSIYLNGSTNGLRLLHDGSNGLIINQSTGDLKIQNSATDKDIIFRGKDGASMIDALTLDMSEGGKATFAGNLTITHANTPRLEIIDTTNDVDFRIRAANSYVYIEADADNDADSTRIQMKVDDDLVHEFLPGSQISHKNLTLRREDTHPSYNFQSRRDSGNFVSGTDIARINFQARDSVVTADTTLATWIIETDNTLAANDKKARMKWQVYTGSSLENVLFLDSDKSATFYGTLSAEDNIYLTDAGTVRAKLLLNASDRDNVELRAESLGSTMKFFTVGTEALELDASQNATFAGNVESQDTFVLNYGGSGNKWQQLFDGSNNWNLRYYNGSSWSSNYLNISTSGNATFTGEVTIKKAVDGDFTGLRIMNQKTYGSGTGNNERPRLVLGIAESGATDSTREGFVIESLTPDETNSANINTIFKTRASGSVTQHVLLEGNNKATTFAGTVTTGGDLTIGGTGGIFIPENIYHRGDNNSYFGFSANDTFELVTNGTQKITADSNAAYLRYQGATKLSTTSGGVSVTGLQVTSDNNFYRETINSNTGGESWNASNGWHRIIEISGGSGRGKCHFLIQSGGGSGTPCRVEAIVNTAWSNTNSTLTIIHNSYPNFITDIRVVRNATSNKSFVDIKGGGDDYVDVTILPDGSTNAAIINFTNVNSLPSNDTMEIHQTLTNMIMSMSTGQGSGNGYDGNAGTGQKPFQVKYDGSIFAEQGTFEGTIYTNQYLTHLGDGNTYLEFAGADNIKLVAGGKNYLHAHDNGNLYLYGNNSTALTLDGSQNATFTNDILTNTDSSSDIGKTDARWANLWVDNINGSTPVTGGPFLPLAAGSGYPLQGSLYFNSSVRSIVWPHTSGQSSSRSWAFIGEQGSYGKFELRMSDAADDTPDTTVLEFNQNNVATFKGSMRVQSDDNDKFLVRSNDYTIARIISRGSSGVNLDKGLFSLMSSDGTNNNVEKVRVDTAGNSWFDGGNVRFGYDVEIDGDLEIDGGNLEINSTMSSSPTSIIYLDVDGSNNTGGGGSIVFSTSASAGTLTNYNAQIRGVRVDGGDGGDSQLEFWTTLVSDQTAPQRRMYITKEGDVVIEKNLTVNGTTTTLNTQTVEVEDNILQLNTTQGSPDTATAATSGISVYRGDGVTQASFIFDDGDDTWDLTNNLNVAGNVLVPSGNIGIGAMPAGGPQAALHVSGSFNTNAPTGNGVFMGLYNSTHGYIQLNGSSGSYIDFSVSGTDHKGRILYDNTSNYMRFDTDGSEKLRIESNGNITLKQKGTIKYEENTDVDSAAAEAVASVVKATHTAAFFDYVIKKGTNVRAGVVTACHDGTNVEFNETSTVDLGDTSDVTLSVDISGTLMRLMATTTSNDWSVKSLIRAI